MFTGIIEEVGVILDCRRTAHAAVLKIRARNILEDVREGDSIAVNGICLTVTSHTHEYFTADVMHETLQRSSIGGLQRGSAVNLERAMRADGRFGGHIVTGHIDGTGTVHAVKRDAIAVWYTIAVPPALMAGIIQKGSIAVDGISLTVAGVTQQNFLVSVIPHTAACTTLREKAAGDTVNLETDCIGKYVARLLHGEAGTPGNLSRAFLMERGFL